MADDLAAARGCILGAILGGTLWAALALTGAALIYLACWQLVP